MQAKQFYVAVKFSTNKSSTMLCQHQTKTATHCNTLQHAATIYNTLSTSNKHCNTLQHTATHCNTLQPSTILCQHQTKKKQVHWEIFVRECRRSNTLMSYGRCCHAAPNPSSIRTPSSKIPSPWSSSFRCLPTTPPLPLPIPLSLPLSLSLPFPLHLPLPLSIRLPEYSALMPSLLVYTHTQNTILHRDTYSAASGRDETSPISLQHAATLCTAVQCTATHATHCTTLHHFTTHCHTLHYME